MTFRLRHILFRAALSAASLFFLVPAVYAHSGKARFHAIIDTDGAADDLRTLCMLLGNREVEVLAVTTSEGAASRRVGRVRAGAARRILPRGRPGRCGASDRNGRSGVEDAFPAGGLGRHALRPDRLSPGAGADRRNARRRGGEGPSSSPSGALTNVCDALRENPALGDRIDRIVWYNNQAEPLAGANFEADSVAAARCLRAAFPWRSCRRTRRVRSS